MIAVYDESGGLNMHGGGGDDDMVETVRWKEENEAIVARECCQVLSSASSCIGRLTGSKYKKLDQIGLSGDDDGPGALVIIGLLLVIVVVIAPLVQMVATLMIVAQLGE